MLLLLLLWLLFNVVMFTFLFSVVLFVCLLLWLLLVVFCFFRGAFGPNGWLFDIHPNGSVFINRAS